MKLTLIFAAFVAAASATYSCPSSKSKLVCNCRLTTSTTALETGNMDLCDYTSGQSDCASHRTKNYCCASVKKSGFTARWNGVDCTGAKNVGSNDVFDDERYGDSDEDDADDEVSEAAIVEADARRIVEQMILRDSRPGREIIAWEFVG